MYDIKPLEKEWKKYRRKKLKPWFFILSIMLFLPFLIYVLFKSNLWVSTIKIVKSKEDNVSKKIPAAIKLPQILLNEALVDILVREKEVMHIEISTREQPIRFNPIKIENKLVEIPLLNKINIETSEPVIKKRMHLDIIESDSRLAYKDVEKRFSRSHDIDDALFLAQYYYKRHNYKKAEYWALQTNKLDETLEESLFIFIKSKYKQKHKNEAISILMAYLKKTNSQEAKKLLYTIKKNKL